MMDVIIEQLKNLAKILIRMRRDSTENSLRVRYQLTFCMQGLPEWSGA